MAVKFQDYYETLGVKRDADEKAINRLQGSGPQMAS